MNKRTRLLESAFFAALFLAVTGLLCPADGSAPTQQKAGQKRRAEITLRPVIDSVDPRQIVLNRGGDPVLIKVRGSYLGMIGSVQVTRAGAAAQGIEEALDQSQLPALLNVSLQASVQAEVTSDYLLTVFDANQNKLLDIPGVFLAVENLASARRTGLAREATLKDVSPNAVTMVAGSIPSPPGPQTAPVLSSTYLGQATLATGGAFQAFLKIDGIMGDSVDLQHFKEIVVKTFGWGEWNAASGTVEMQPFAFTMPVSCASTELFLACATGKLFPDAVLMVRNAAGRDYLIVKFINAVVTSYKTTADTSQGGPPIDEIALRFECIEMTYVPFNPDGTAGAKVTAKWNVRENVRYQ